MHSRAVSVLMFIVESGVGYCLLWVRRSDFSSAVVLIAQYLIGRHCFILRNLVEILRHVERDREQICRLHGALCLERPSSTHCEIQTRLYSGINN